jgi:hypothetical protein
VVEAERGETGGVLDVDRLVAAAELGERCVDVAGVPQDKGVEDQAERAEPVLLPLTVGLVHVAALPVVDLVGELAADRFRRPGR